MRILATLALVPMLALGACQTPLSDFAITQSQLDGARSSYDAVVLTPAAHYRALGICKTGVSATLAAPCADRAIVLKLQGIDNAVASDFNTLQSQITAGTNTGTLAAWNDLQTQIVTAKQIVAALGTT